MQTNQTTPKGPITPIPYKPRKNRLPLILLAAVVLAAVLAAFLLPANDERSTVHREPAEDQQQEIFAAFGTEETENTEIPTEAPAPIPTDAPATIPTEMAATLPQETTLPPVDTSGEAPYRIVRWDRSYRTEDNKSGMDYYFDYVILEGDSPAYRKINEYIYADAERFMTYYSADGPITIYGDYTIVGTCYAESKVIFNQNGLLCVKVYTDEYMGGNTSHSDSYSMFFSLATGEIVGLPELTGIDAETLLPQLRSIAITQLKNSYGSMLLDSAESTVNNMTLDDFDYYVADGEIWLHFEKYSVTPGICGAVNIPTGLYIGGN